MNDPRSAFDDVTRCARGCGATVAYPYPSGQTMRAAAARAGLPFDITDRDVDKDDADFVEQLRHLGWQVVNGEWTCPNDLTEVLRDLPGAMGRRRNPYCSNCGDTRGGSFGHETDECTRDGMTSGEPAVGSVILVTGDERGSGRSVVYQRGARGWHGVSADPLMSWADLNAWTQLRVIHRA